MTKVLVAVGVSLVLLAGSARAADPATNEARSKHEKGMRLYNLSRYAEALTEFEAAYLAKPDPAFLFNIAQCQRQLGKNGEAIKVYRAFLREAPSLSPSQREQVQKIVADLERARAEVLQQQPPVAASFLSTAHCLAVSSASIP